ncbi:STAS domain-containing protein [Sphaerisporangium fuscum]|uniref:STAS domain-containing protein n=1 Tax=Sphaerisporangium fuscum TaxID=2835868 RepID=UPI001BDCE073|nr:STAS domain-containing protein [Sphaerisporangium fuscum]
MTALTIRLAHDQDHTSITLTGDLDVLSAVCLDDAVETALHDGRRHLTVDTAALTFCGSSGVWALLRAQRAVTAVQGTMTLTNVHGVLRRILDITHLTAAFRQEHDHGLPSFAPPQAPVKADTLR